MPKRSCIVISKTLLCGFCVLLACMANAYDLKWSPFQAGKPPHPYPMQRCKVVKTFINTKDERATWVLHTPKAAGVVLVVSRTLDANAIRITNRKTGQQLLAPAKIKGWIMGDEAPEVYTGLLNEDTGTDFVLQV